MAHRYLAVSITGEKINVISYTNAELQHTATGLGAATRVQAPTPCSASQQMGLPAASEREYVASVQSCRYSAKALTRTWRGYDTVLELTVVLHPL